MLKNFAAVIVLVAGAAAGCTASARHTEAATSPVASPAGTAAAATCSPNFDATNFVDRVDNRYFPLPVGRRLVYEGVREGQKQTDTVTVTAQRRVVDGVTATVATDVATHNRTKLEDTIDYYAQDRQGNVWYLGENTKSFNPDGTVDTSGSWTAGVDGAVPGVIMLADPQVPCGYRQEYYKGNAEDTAWIIGRGVSITIPYGTVRDTVRSIEATILEPDVVDEKIYAAGLGIVRERSIAGPNETAALVSVSS